MIATLVMSIVSLGLVEFFAKGRVWFEHEEHKRVATLLAQDAMETTVDRTYADISPWTDERVVGTTEYEIDVRIQNNAPDPELKTVRSRVTWQATPAASRTVELVTFVYDH